MSRYGDEALRWCEDDEAPARHNRGLGGWHRACCRVLPQCGRAWPFLKQTPLPGMTRRRARPTQASSSHDALSELTCNGGRAAMSVPSRKRDREDEVHSRSCLSRRCGRPWTGRQCRQEAGRPRLRRRTRCLRSCGSTARRWTRRCGPSVARGWADARAAALGAAGAGCRWRLIWKLRSGADERVR